MPRYVFDNAQPSYQPNEADQTIASIFQPQQASPRYVFDTNIAQAPQPAVAPQEQGFIGRIGQDLSKRGDMLNQITNEYQTQGVPLANTIYRGVGNVGFGALKDVGNEVIGEGLGALGNFAAQPYNDLPEGIKRRIGGAASSAMDSSGNYLANVNPVTSGIYTAGKEGLAQAGDAVQRFAQANPEAMKDLGAMGNIVAGAPMINPAVKGLGVASDIAGTGLLKTGKALENKAVSQVANRRTDFIEELLTPKQTPSIAQSQVSRTSVSKFGNKTVQMSPEQQEIAAAIEPIKRLSSKNTLQGNYNILTQEIGKEAGVLKTELDKTPGIFPKKELISRFNSVAQQVNNLPSIISGNKQAWAKQLISDAQKAIAANPGTAAGMLQARKDLDAVIKKYRPKAFDPVTENALSEIVPKIRETMNNFIAEKAPTVAVRESLKKQNLYYKARDIIEPKAAMEKPTFIGRRIDKIPGKGNFEKLVAGAAGAGLFGAGTLVPYAAPIATTGAALYGAGKVLNSPILKKGVGKTLSATGKVLKK